MLTSSVCNIESRMLPIAVLVPTPTTTARALPATTTVPWKSRYAGTCLLPVNFYKALKFIRALEKRCKQQKTPGKGEKSFKTLCHKISRINKYQKEYLEIYVPPNFRHITIYC